MGASVPPPLSVGSLMNQAHDDDGIIDLRALASTPPPRGAFVVPSPFASEPPPAFTRDASDEHGDGTPARRSKGKAIALITAAALVVLGCVGGAYAFRGAKPAPAAAAVVVAVPAPPPVVAPAPPVAEPAPASLAASATTAAEDNSASVDAATAKKTKNAKPRAGGARTTPKATAVPSKPAVAKSTDSCNCHGDFQCNIRCAASK